MDSSKEKFTPESGEVFNKNNSVLNNTDSLNENRQMNLSQLLFSFKGRINRKQYWLAVLFSWIVLWPSYLAGYVLFPYYYFYGIKINILGLAINLILLFPALAVMVKRCHDNNRSGWFLLLFLVPILQIWPAIEIPFIRGDAGDNRFGPPPI